MVWGPRIPPGILGSVYGCQDGVRGVTRNGPGLVFVPVLFCLGTMPRHHHLRRQRRGTNTTEQVSLLYYSGSPRVLNGLKKTCSSFGDNWMLQSILEGLTRACVSSAFDESTLSGRCQPGAEPKKNCLFLSKQRSLPQTGPTLSGSVAGLRQPQRRLHALRGTRQSRHCQHGGCLTGGLTPSKGDSNSHPGPLLFGGGQSELEYAGISAFHARDSPVQPRNTAATETNKRSRTPCSP